MTISVDGTGKCQLEPSQKNGGCFCVFSINQYSFGNGAELDRTVFISSETADKMAVLWLVQLVAGFSSRRAVLIPGRLAK